MYYYQKVLLCLMVGFIIQLSGCSQKREALGAGNEIRVICSNIDKPFIIKYLTSIFIDTLYSPEPEPFYYLKFSDPSTYKDLKDQAQVIVAAIDRDSRNSGYNLIKRILPENQFIETETGDPVILAKNVHADKQLFMVINASTKEQLYSTIEDKRDYIRKQFHDLFIDRQSRYIFGDDRNKKLEDSLNTEYGWTLKIPWGWQSIKKTPDSSFVWLGRELPFQWIGISWDEGNQVNDELRVGENIWAWPASHYESIRFNDYHFSIEKTTFKDNNAWRAKGIWETIDLKDSKGGPFQSYIFYDKKKDRTYHINYLIHFPGNDKSIFMRQLDLIVKTFSVLH